MQSVFEFFLLAIENIDPLSMKFRNYSGLSVREVILKKRKKTF